MFTDNLPRWDGAARPYYEVWFFKLNHRATGSALWVRYTTLSPRYAAEPARGELWAIWFDNAGGEHRAAKRLFPMSQVGQGRDPILRLGDAELGNGHARGSLEDLRWELSYEPNAGTYHHVPAALRGLVPTAVCSPNIDLAMNGWFEVGGRRFECRREPGQQGHIWGKKYGHRWSWGHCNAFAGAPGAVFEGVTAQLKVGPVVTPHLTSVFVRWRGGEHVVNGPVALLTTPSEHELGRWTFTATDGDTRFVGELTAARKDIVGVGYTDTDGSIVYCHNAKIGSMVLDIQKREGDRWRGVEFLEAKGTAALEFTERTAHPAIPVRAR